MSTEINYELCTGCRICHEVCPLDIISWDDDKNLPDVSYPDECQLCFICQEDCPDEAIKVKVPIIFW